MKTRSLILDADGMVVHGTRFSTRLETDFGIPVSTTTPFFQNEFQLCLIGKADLKESLAPYLLQWGWKKSVDDFLLVWFADEHTQIDTRFAPLIESIRRKGVLVFLATNNEKYRTDYLVGTRKLGLWFDGVFSSSYLGVKKTDSSFWNYIFVNRVHSPKQSVVVWDDDNENLQTAEGFGMRTELYTNFEDFVLKTQILLE